MSERREKGRGREGEEERRGEGERERRGEGERGGGREKGRGREGEREREGRKREGERERGGEGERRGEGERGRKREGEREREWEEERRGEGERMGGREILKGRVCDVSLLCWLVSHSQVLTRSHCRKSTIYTFFLRDSGIQLAMLPDQSQVKLDCEPLAVAVFGNQSNLTSIEWSKDSIQIAGNFTDRRVIIFNDNQELLIDGLTKAIGLDGYGTEGKYTCKVCLNQRCNESTIEVVIDPDGKLMHNLLI